MPNPSHLNGRCLCGSVQFKLRTPTDFLAHCHCLSCRLAHGAAFTTWTSVPEQQFELLKGEQQLKWYATSDWIEWGFCSSCGSSMLYRAVKEGHREKPKTDRVYATVSSLDGIDHATAVHVSYEEHASWYNADKKLDKFKGKGDEKL